MEKKTKNNFEKNISRLQEISDLLESENIGLEDAIGLYEEGVILSKSCIEELRRAELKITQIKAKALSISSGGDIDENINGDNV
jgi:exodeoxyribonuclease VII small subunit